MSHEYRLASCKLISDIELPELSPWHEHATPTAVLRFRLGQTAAIAGSKTYVIPAPRRIVIEDGIQVTIEPEDNGDMADTRALLMGPVQAILWHQRGLLPLHASAVSVKGVGVAVAGPSGVGKSTLAAALADQGCAVLADDISIVDPKTVTILTGQRRLRLWRSALEHLRISPDDLPRAISRTEKFVLNKEGGPVPERQKLAHIVLPVRSSCDGAELKLLRGSDAILALTDVVHALPAAHELGLGPAIFRALTQIQRTGVCVWRFFLPDDLAAIEGAALSLLTQLNV
jgi:HPr Serine kinase C-terminal domain